MALRLPKAAQGRFALYRENIMNNRYKGLAAIAGLALAAAASPVLAQNATETFDNAIDDVGNAASNAGDSIVAGANSVGNAVDDAVDVDVATTTDANLGAADLNASATDANLTGMEPMNDVDMVTTTTTTTERESSGKGAWGLLGLAGLLSFLIRPKTPAIHLDERHDANPRI